MVNFADSHLNFLGAYFAPVTTATSSTPLTPSPAKKLQAKGGNGGASWDDGAFGGVKKILVGQGNDGVAFVMFEYNKGSHVILGKKTVLGTETFELDYPSEYITSVEAYYDKVFGAEAEVVSTLTFKTKRRTSQPFGMAGGEYFELKEEGYNSLGSLIWFIRSESTSWAIYHQLQTYSLVSFLFPCFSICVTRSKAFSVFTTFVCVCVSVCSSVNALCDHACDVLLPCVLPLVDFNKVLFNLF